MSIIEASDLARSFRTPKKDPGLGGAVKALFRPEYTDRTAVDGISFSVEPGEMVGYIGVNGAGKSTTIKLLTGILLPTAGSIRVLGRDPYRQRIANARDIGVVFGQRSQLWWDLALIESLNLTARIYEISPDVYRRNLGQFRDLLGLDELLNKPVRTMSLGQKMRAELAATLLHDPQVVYLDEPTIGLDVVVKERIRAFIRQVNRERNTTVILTTHDLSDIEELCQRIIILDAGRIIYDGPLATIRDRFGKYRIISFETNGLADTPALPTGAELIDCETGKLAVRFDRFALSASTVAAAVMQQADVIDFALTEPDLESIVKQIYRGALREEATA